MFWGESIGQKINANFFCTKFFNYPSGHGRPRRTSWTSAPKSALSCGPGGGEKLFDPWAFGRKGQECPWEIRAKKFMFMLLFFPESKGCVLKGSLNSTEIPKVEIPEPGI